MINYFSHDEMTTILEQNGYTVKLVTVNMRYSVYHNDVEYEDVEVWGVFDGDGEYKKPSYLDFKKYDWLRDAFTSVAKQKVFDFLIKH